MGTAIEPEPDLQCGSANSFSYPLEMPVGDLRQCKTCRFDGDNSSLVECSAGGLVILSMLVMVISTVIKSMKLFLLSITSVNLCVKK